MLAVFRMTFIAVVVSFVLLAVTATTAHAQNWSTGIRTELTSVESSFQNGAYIWTLVNKSSLSGDMDSAFDILVWELIPFQVQEPLSVGSPEGWTWTGGKWEVQPGQKYYTPDSIAPGQSLTFTYTPNPAAGMINSQGPQPSELGFLAHAGAVARNSGSANGSLRWISVQTEYGETWYDRAVIMTPMSPVPEPKGFLVLAVGLYALGSAVSRFRGERH